MRGGVASLGAQGISMVVSLGAIAALSRLLGPEDFGLLAMVVVFTRFAGMFVDAGLSTATVQVRELSPQQATNLFWFGTLMGGLVGAAIAAIAPLLAWIYGEPKLVPITIVLGLSFVFNGLAVQHRALLRRGMQFVTANSVRVVAAVIGKLAGIAWAIAFYGKPYDYWALVVVIVVTALADCVGVWLWCPWRPGLPRRGVGSRAHFSFGANLTGFTTVNHFARNADNFLIGWWWNAAVLGVYERAYRVFDLPRDTLIASLSGLATAVLSRLADEPAKYREAYMKMAEGTLMLTAPALAYCAACPDLVVHTLLGKQWSSAVPLLQILAVFGIFQGGYSTCGWLFISQGRTSEFLRWSLINSVLTVASFAVGVPYGPQGVAIAYGFVFVLYSLPTLFWMAGRKGPVATPDLWKLLIRPAIAAALVGFSSYVIRAAVLPWGIVWATVVTALVAVGIVGAYVWVATDAVAWSRDYWAKRARPNFPQQSSQPSK